jgi:hypothetical protein
MKEVVVADYVQGRQSATLKRLPFAAIRSGDHSSPNFSMGR